LAFSCTIADGSVDQALARAGCEWFPRLPDGLYAEQREFLARRLGMPG
jgi:hypothetical protein